MKSKASNSYFWFCLVLLLIFTIGCNLQPFLNDMSGTNNSWFPTHFRCTTEKGLLFGADFPKSQASDGTRSYMFEEEMDFFLDFSIPEDNRPIGISIDYLYNITQIHPIIKYDDNKIVNIEDGITKIYKSGQGEGFWVAQKSEDYFTGKIKEKVKVEYIKPEQENGETEVDYWFVGFENYFNDTKIQPQIFLCIHTSEFNVDTIKTAGEEGFADFCSLPEYGYFVCNPR